MILRISVPEEDLMILKIMKLSKDVIILEKKGIVYPVRSPIECKVADH